MRAVGQHLLLRPAVAKTLSIDGFIDLLQWSAIDLAYYISLQGGVCDARLDGWVFAAKHASFDDITGRLSPFCFLHSHIFGLTIPWMSCAKTARRQTCIVLSLLGICMKETASCSHVGSGLLQPPLLKPCLATATQERPCLM